MIVARIHSIDAWKLAKLFEVDMEKFQKPVKSSTGQKGFELTSGIILFKVHLRENYHHYFVYSYDEKALKEILGRVCGKGNWCFINIPIGNEKYRKRNFTVVKGKQFGGSNE